MANGVNFEFVPLRSMLGPYGMPRARPTSEDRAREAEIRQEQAEVALREAQEQAREIAAEHVVLATFKEFPDLFTTAKGMLEETSSFVALLDDPLFQSRVKEQREMRSARLRARLGC